MKDTFAGRWSTVNTIALDEVSHLILTGRTAAEAKGDDWLTEFLGDTDKPQTILDFGCGFGRNTLCLGNKMPHWTIIGYDSDQMISRVPEYASIHYEGRIPNNVWFITDWDQILHHKFDKILCNLVLQHIHPEPLAIYAKDFKKITNLLLVNGRRYNDGEGRRSTWTILEEQGLVPDKFLAGHQEIPYQAEGDPSEHNLAYYYF